MQKTENKIVVHFHIGRGGMFNNQGHKTFVGEEKITDTKVLEDLFLVDTDEEGNTLPDEDWTLQDGSGNILETGKTNIVGDEVTIDRDGQYDTDIFKYVDNCNKEEIALIRKSDDFDLGILSDNLIEFVKKHTTVLHLSLKSCWYDMIESGDKREEYREIKPYWIKRFVSTAESDSCLNSLDKEHLATLLKRALVSKYRKQFDAVEFSYGYTRRSMTFEIEDIRIDTGKPEWGAEPGKEYIVISIGKRIF